MEHEIDLDSTTLLHYFPDDCSKDPFEFIQIDSINLAKSCGYFNNVANGHTFDNYSSFEINQSNYKVIGHIVPYIGIYVTSLTIDCEWKQCSRLNETLADFKNIRYLRVRITNCLEAVEDNDLSLSNFDNVEVLSLAYCDSSFAKGFLQNFHKLKCLKIFTTDFQPNDLEMIFQNNPDIESFIYCCSERGADFEFDYRLIQMIPKVRRLSISVSDDLNLKSLVNLNQLTKLHINCQWLSINDGLKELARNGILEDIQLLNAFIDADLFTILKLFDKLQLLVITTSKSSTPDSTFPWSSNWPSKLKQLRLAGTTITRTDFISTIKQLKLLEIIDIGRCGIGDAVDEQRFQYGTEFYQQIFDVVIGENRQWLDVILPAVLNLGNANSFLGRSEVTFTYNHTM